MKTYFTKEKEEECGVAAVYSKKGKGVTQLLYNALIALQHRGQDAAGMALYHNGEITQKKGVGLVGEIFKKDDVGTPAKIGIGHTRYPTTGRCDIEDVQPSVFGEIAVAHNGHLANYNEVREMLEREGYVFTSTVDSEPIVYLLDKKIKTGESIQEAVRYVMETLDGAYSDVAIIKGKLVIFRDPHAIRPLVYGENEEFLSFASESAALDINGIDYKGVVEGGSVVILDEMGNTGELLIKKETRHCMFEYVYFSRPDSCINDRWVFEVRWELGKLLAAEHPAEADVVVPVPDTARTAAAAYSKETGIPLAEGIIKNRYVGRTFIMPTQESRAKAVHIKLSAVRPVIDGKRIVLVDDSIVRGTTIREIIKILRRAGAKEVHLRIACPPIKAPCFYGVNMATYGELIANNKSIEEIRKFLGAESLGYLSIDGLREAVGLPVCTGCLNEDYPTPKAVQLAKKRKGGFVGSC